MPLFLDIYFIHRYNIEVDEEKIYNLIHAIFRLGFACGFVGYVLKLGCNGSVDLY
jgi:hypothetical protein